MKARAVIVVLFLSVSICFVTCNDREVNNVKERPNTRTFGKYYEPYEPNIQPNAPRYTLPLDIKDIVNFNDVGRVINLKGVSNLIRKNGFAILEPGIYSDLFYHDLDSLYSSLEEYKIPAFVTLDTGLYLYHTLLDEALKGIEDPHLRTRICDLKNQPFTVGKYGSGAYVRGIDLMALLGSCEATNILMDEGNAGYEHRELKPSKSKDEVYAFSHVNWHANLYWSWLYTLRALLNELPEGYPEFMRTQAWRRHQLYTALASWVQLHDDTIRRPDPTEPRPIAIGVTRVRIPPPPSLGYVEPIPLFWGRLLSLTRMTSKGLDELGVLTLEARERFTEFEKLLIQILDIVSRQLTYEPPSSEESDFFDKLPSILGRMLPGVQEHGLATILTFDIRTSETDAMGIEQAIGDIDLIIVACPMPDGKTFLAVGPVLSYYEFKHPMSKHFTDESWRLILNSPNKPDRPKWYAPLLRLNKNSYGLIRLTNNLLRSESPCWSPDGKIIVFVGTDNDWNPDIYVMNADGREKKNLTNNPALYLLPCWSPDGKKIAFVEGDKPNNHYDIYVMSSDGSELKRLTDNNTDNSSPCWSPDGKKIVFESGRYLRREIYIMNDDGSEQKRITNNSTDDSSPSWSPSGQQIVFVSDRDQNLEIYVMNEDGSEQKKLTNNPAIDLSPRWSPDGKKIAFASDRDGNFEIYVMNADGSEQKRLTNNCSKDGSPCWSPDGKKIAFASFIGGNPEIYIMDLDIRNK